MLITGKEIIDLLLMTVAIGYIFMDVAAKGVREAFNLQRFKRAVLLIAPAIILHEMAHKFTAVGFGLDATFQAHYLFLGLGILLKLLNFGFIFLIPGYVSIPAISTPLQGFLIALAGPAVHAVFYGVGKLKQRAVEKAQPVKEQQWQFWRMWTYINGFLFILNMLPIPGIDGWHVYANAFRLIGG